MSSGGGLVKIAGVDKDVLRDFWDIEVDPEVWKEFKSRRNGALLGAGIARDRDMKDRYVWEPGKEFAMADFDGLTLYMAGTFTPRDPTLASAILTGDVFLQEVDDRRGITNQVLVRIAHRDDAQRIGEGIDRLKAPVKLHTESMQNALDLAIADLDDLLRYVGHVILVVAVVILVGLVNATSMSVRDRVREVGVLRSLGFRRRGVTAVIAGESFLLAMAGGLVGCVGAWAGLIAVGLKIDVASYSFPVRVSATVGLAAVAAAALVGILGGLPAAIRASRRPITESLRSVD
ncbi:MAG: ABC transporter permease [Planctomycetota bacterium]